MCLFEETTKVVGPFYLVSMPWEAKHPTQGVNVLHILEKSNSEINHSGVSLKQGCLEH